MELEVLITDLALIMMVAGAVTLIFKKINQPVVLGYLVAGIMVSPNMPIMPDVANTAEITVWADIGVIFLMFGLGLEFSFKKLTTIGGSAFIVAISVMGPMIFIGTGIGSVLGWSKLNAIFLGCMLSMSSTMIILKAYEGLGLKKENFAQVVLGTLVIEDIAGIFMMIVLSTISVSQNVSGLEMANEMGLMLIILTIWLILGIYLIPTFLNRTASLVSDEMVVIISVGICFGMVIISNLIGFSSALGAFITGSIMAGTVHSDRIDRLVTPIKDMFGAIFFVSVGMLIDPQLLVKYIGPILIITVVTIICQSFFSTMGIILSGQTLKVAIKGGSSMVQIGEFSFILATLGTSLGVLDDYIYPIVVCVSIITSFTTPLMIKNSDKTYEAVDRILPNTVKIWLRKFTSDKTNLFDKDKDWFDYIMKVFMRTSICSALMFVIYMVGYKFFMPFLYETIDSRLVANIIGTFVMILAMVPETRLMHGSARDALFSKLWLKHRANRLPLLTLRTARILLAACFMGLVIRKIWHIPYGIIVALLIVPVIFIVKSEYVRGLAINIELRFMANFAQKTLVKEKKERGVTGNMKMINESLHVAEFKVVGIGEELKVIDFTGRRGFLVSIIKIIHEDGTYVNLPMADEKIIENDVIHVMGSAIEIEEITVYLEKSRFMENTPKPNITLKDYIYGQTFKGLEPDEQIYCIPLKVNSTMSFCRKAIKYSRIREKYRATVIGIERGNLPITSPDMETIIQDKDLLWLLGNKVTVDKMIKADILDSAIRRKANV